MAFGRDVLIIEVEDAGVNHPVAAGFGLTHLPDPPGPFHIEIEADAGYIERTHSGDSQKFADLIALALVLYAICRLAVEPPQGRQPRPIDKKAIIRYQGDSFLLDAGLLYSIIFYRLMVSTSGEQGTLEKRQGCRP